MSYQVLARKYRPQNFSELVGQDQVSRALRHALETNRLHHAYLFSGTRGVGKTTLARIIGRCLNCEKGVSANPCGHCSACQAIGEGRFVDLIEVDAASRTKVEDTRDLLDNVQYAPTVGRFKVYLIDEVHMLSTHSFNALLKTLEEPPPHVKFLLATTDPQKLPVTVLSRCLQFNLKMLPTDLIADHLAQLLTQENIPFDIAALRLVGRAAAGSMRDALSLTDQAIAFGNESLDEAGVRELLGSVDREHVLKLLTALASGKPKELLQCIDDIFSFHPDALELLDELISHLHQLAISQIVPDRGDEQLAPWVGQFQAEQLQLYYDIAVRGREGLLQSADGRAGLEMLLLRMLLFSPKGVLLNAPLPPTDDNTTKDAPPIKKRRAPAEAPQSEPSASLEPTVAADHAESNSTTAPENVKQRATVDADAKLPNDVVNEAATEKAPDEDENQPTQPAANSNLNDSWCDLVPRLGLDGGALHLAASMALVKRDGALWRLQLAESERIWDSAERRQQLLEAIAGYFGKTVELEFEFVATVADSPHGRAEQRRQLNHQQAVESVTGDAKVQQLVELFDARLDPASIHPLNEESYDGI